MAGAFKRTRSVCTDGVISTFSNLDTFVNVLTDIVDIVETGTTFANVRTSVISASFTDINAIVCFSGTFVNINTEFMIIVEFVTGDTDTFEGTEKIVTDGLIRTTVGIQCTFVDILTNNSVVVKFVSIGTSTIVPTVEVVANGGIIARVENSTFIDIDTGIHEVEVTICTATFVRTDCVSTNFGLIVTRFFDDTFVNIGTVDAITRETDKTGTVVTPVKVGTFSIGMTRIIITFVDILTFTGIITVFKS